MGASAGGLRAGKAFIELALQSAGVKGELVDLQQRMSKIGKGMQQVGTVAATAGGVITGAFAGALKIFTDTGDKLDKMAARTGFSVESLSTLGHVAGLSGSSLDTLGAAALKMDKFMLRASRGGKNAAMTLDTLGISLSDLEGLSPEDQFKLIADRLSSIADPGKKAALAMEVFGGAGQELLPMLNLGAAGIEEMQAKATAMGLQMSTADAAAAATFGDALSGLWDQLKAVANTIAAAVAGPLTAFVAATQPIIGSLIAWAKEHPGLIQLVAALGAGLTVLGTALMATGAAIALSTTAMGGLTVAVGAVSTAFAFLAANPIVAAIAAITAFATWFLTSTELGKGLVKTVIEWFSKLGPVITKVVDFISGVWHGFTDRFLKAWNFTVAEFKKKWAIVKGIFTGGASEEIERINRELADANKAIDDARKERNSKRDEGPVAAPNVDTEVIAKQAAEMAAEHTAALESTAAAVAQPPGLNDSILQAGRASVPNDAEKRTADATERTADATEEIARRAFSGTLTYSE